MSQETRYDDVELMGVSFLGSNFLATRNIKQTSENSLICFG